MRAGAMLARGAAIRLTFGMSALLEPEQTSRLSAFHGARSSRPVATVFASSRRGT